MIVAKVPAMIPRRISVGPQPAKLMRNLPVTTQVVIVRMTIR